MEAFRLIRGLRWHLFGQQDHQLVRFAPAPSACVGDVQRCEVQRVNGAVMHGKGCAESVTWQVGS